jgi:hypothetical protein
MVSGEVVRWSEVVTDRLAHTHTTDTPYLVVDSFPLLQVVFSDAERIHRGFRKHYHDPYRRAVAVVCVLKIK